MMGIVSWLLISREVLPRLGQQVRRSNAAGWAAAAVFLAFWLPYNNGLRAEPVVVLFSLLALCAVERAVATKRLLPAALGLVVAALSVAANPHGMVSVLPYIAAANDPSYWGFAVFRWQTCPQNIDAMKVYGVGLKVAAVSLLERVTVPL